MATMAEVAAYYPGLALAAREESKPDTWLDGPRLAEWARERGIGRGDDNQMRRIRGWRAGGVAHYSTVDKLLTDTDYTLDDLPDDLWVEKRYAPALTPAQRVAIARVYEAGQQGEEWRQAVADACGVSVHHVRRLVTDYRAGRL